MFEQTLGVKPKLAHKDLDEAEILAVLDEKFRTLQETVSKIDEQRQVAKMEPIQPEFDRKRIAASLINMFFANQVPRAIEGLRELKKKRKVVSKLGDELEPGEVADAELEQTLLNEARLKEEIKDINEKLKEVSNVKIEQRRADLEQVLELSKGRRSTVRYFAKAKQEAPASI